MAIVSGPMSLMCFDNSTPTPPAINIAPSHASVRISGKSEKTSRRCIASSRAAVSGARLAASISDSYEITSHQVCDREPDLRCHHHQIHVTPRRVVLGRGQLLGITYDQPERVDAPHREHASEDVEREAVAG